MAEYDYGNARLRAMKSRLLSGNDLEKLIGADSIEGVINYLAKTNYQSAVEIALTMTSGIESIEIALRYNLESTVGKIPEFYQDEAGKLVAILLRNYDIHNVKAILRGVTNSLPSGEILKSLLPVGELDIHLLRNMSRLPNTREVIDSLASLGIPLAQPLIGLRVEKPGAELFEFELALDNWHYQEAKRNTRHARSMDKSIRDFLALDADIANISTVLHLLEDKGESKRLNDYFRGEAIEKVLIGPGYIPFVDLIKAYGQGGIVKSIETLSVTYLGPSLHDGLNRFEKSHRLTDIEKSLRRYKLEWTAGRIVKDPLGIGVVIGYLALKMNEISNIRWISKGISLGLRRDAIQAELEIYP